MVLRFLHWLSRKQDEHVSHEVVHINNLPDDILINILSRLPVEELLSCLRVCTHWNFLIPSPYFNHCYVNRVGAVPAILAHHKRLLEGFTRLQFLKEDHHKKGISTWMNSFCNIIMRSRRNIQIPVPLGGGDYYLYNSPEFVLSYHGLVLFRREKSYYIMNPITQELATFDLPVGYIAAFFFHQVAKEYYALWIRELPFVEFRMLRLSSLLSDDPEITETTGWEKFCDVHVPQLRPRITVLCREARPTWTKDAIYWMAERCCPTNSATCAICAAHCEASIILFDIKEENFQVISHPGEKCGNQHSRNIHACMHLFETNGHVSLCNLGFYSTHKTIDIWDLENYYRWSLRKTINIESKPLYFSCLVRPIGILNGELIISDEFRGIFACNLQSQTIRMLEKEWDDKVLFISAFIHCKTVVSLGNFYTFKKCRPPTSKPRRLLSKLKSLLSPIV